MASPTYGTTYELNERTYVQVGIEKVAAGTVAAAFIKEEHGTFSFSPTRNIFVNAFRTGFPSRRQGTQETWHFADWTLVVPAHPNGAAGMAAAALMGDVTNTGTADTITGSGSPNYAHSIVPGVLSTRCVSLSAQFVSLMDGGGTPALQFLYSVVKSVKISGASGAALMAEIQATSFWPSSLAAASGTWMTTEHYLFGYHSSHTVYNAAGSGLSAQITDGDVMISRQVTAIPSYNNSGSQNPLDVIPYDLNLQANLTLYYDGLASGKHYQEYLSYLKAGSSTHKNVIKWVDPATPFHGFEFDFYPAAWSTDTPSTGEGLMTCTATLDAEQDFASATQTTPVMTTLQSAVITNQLATTMVF